MALEILEAEVLKLTPNKSKYTKSKLEIKVIKKNAEKITKTFVVREKNVQQKVNNRMASTVSGWVNECQQERYEKTRQSILFMQDVCQKKSPSKSEI